MSLFYFARTLVITASGAVRVIYKHQDVLQFFHWKPDEWSISGEGQGVNGLFPEKNCAQMTWPK